MKHIFSLLILLTGLSSFAQSTSEAEAEAKKVVTDFFEAFHRQDSLALKNLAHPEVKMQSIGANKEGVTKLSTSAYGDFIKSIVSIPSSTKFEEKLHAFDVQVNGPLAQVVTAYTFHIDGNLSHCGVNSFTMVKEADEWKIVYLIDTRKREGCETM